MLLRFLRWGAVWHFVCLGGFALADPSSTTQLLGLSTSDELELFNWLESIDSAVKDNGFKIDNVKTAVQLLSGTVGNMASDLLDSRNYLQAISEDTESISTYTVKLADDFNRWITTGDGNTQWLKEFLTGRSDGSNTAVPRFIYAGAMASAATSSEAVQSLQSFLARSLGQFVWSQRGSMTFENVFVPGVSSSDSYLGGSIGMFPVWLAEAMRRNLATNQAILSVLQDKLSSGIQPWDILTNVQQYAYSYPGKVHPVDTVGFYSTTLGQLYDDHHGDATWDNVFLAGDKRQFTRFLAHELRRLDSSTSNLVSFFLDESFDSTSGVAPPPGVSNLWTWQVLEALRSSSTNQTTVSEYYRTFERSVDGFTNDTSTLPPSDEAPSENPYLQTDLDSLFASMDQFGTNYGWRLPAVTNFSSIAPDEFVLRSSDFPAIEQLNNDFDELRDHIDRAATQLRSQVTKLNQLQSVFAASPVLRLRVKGAFNSFASLAGVEGDLPSQDVVIDFSRHLNTQLLDTVSRWLWQFIQFFACFWIALQFIRKILSRA